MELKLLKGSAPSTLQLRELQFKELNKSLRNINKLLCQGGSTSFHNSILLNIVRINHFVPYRFSSTHAIRCIISTTMINNRVKFLLCNYLINKCICRTVFFRIVTSNLINIEGIVVCGIIDLISCLCYTLEYPKRRYILINNPFRDECNLVLGYFI